MELTTTEKINEKLDKGGATLEDIVEDFINEHKISAKKAEMEKGVDYYNNDNDILKRKMTYYKKGRELTDETATNNRIPHNWHKLLVKQKMGYMVGKPMTFSDKEAAKEDEDKTPNYEFVKVINDELGEKWDDTVNELVKEAANKGVEWLHPYINSDGQFDYTIIDARQAIPIWEGKRQEKLQAFIRYYKIDWNGEERIKAEYWTAEDVTYLIEDENGKFRLDTSYIDKDTGEVDNPQGHFDKVKRAGDKIISKEAAGWGLVPFISFKNNEEMISDLNQYKELIDEYDKNRSDLANNLEDIQEVIWVLKNYQGQSLAEFQHNLRYYKALNVDSEGGADTITVDIPTEAKKEHTDQLTDDIYKFGMGVNIDTDKFGNSPSGVALRFLYSLLDLKCDTLERKFKRAIRKLLEFISIYYKFAKNKNYDHKKINITFNKSMVANEAELVKMASNSKGVVSDETVLENHPWVDDPQKEKEKIEKERDSYINLDDIDLGDELEGDE